MVELGQVLLGKQAPATEAELQQKGWIREPTTGLVIPRGTTLSAEQVKSIGEQTGRQQFQSGGRIYYTPQPFTSKLPSSVQLGSGMKELYERGQAAEGKPFTMQQIKSYPQTQAAKISDARQVTVTSIPAQVIQSQNQQASIQQASQSGTLYEKQTSTFKTPDGKTVPVNAVYFKDSQGNERRATSEEEAYYRKQPGVLAAVTKQQEQKYGIIQKSEKFLKEQEYKSHISPVGEVLVGAGLSLLGSAKFTKSILTEPIVTIKSVPSGIKQTVQFISSGELSKIISEKPGIVLGYGVTEYYTAKGTGAVGSKLLDISEVARTRISPKYRGLIEEGDKQIIKDIPSTVVKGELLKIEIAKGLSDIKVPLSEQVKVAGKDINAVSAARSFFKPLRSEVKINKPIIPGKSDLLEQSMFFDPYGKLRVSRLGILEKQRQASILDIIYGDVTFRKGKPQAVLLEKTPVEAFPKKLKSIEYKLKTGKSLTTRESEKLLRFQLKPSGKLKPIGYLSTEPEVILPTPEIIQKVELSARTIIKGKPVQIIAGRIKSATIETAELLSKSEKGLLNLEEESRLSKRLIRETGFKSYELTSRPYYPPSRGLSKIKYLSGSSKDIDRISQSIGYGLSKSKVSPFYKSVDRAVYKKYPLKISKQVNYEPKYRTTRSVRYPKSPTYKPPRYAPPIYPDMPFKDITYKPSVSSKKKRRSMKSMIGYDVYKILKGKPVPVARGLYKEAALDIGTRETLKSLRATFFLKKSDISPRDIYTGGEFRTYRSAFREPVAKSKYRKYGEAYIQKSTKSPSLRGGRLSFKGELAEIKSARMNKIMRSIA